MTSYFGRSIQKGAVLVLCVASSAFAQNHPPHAKQTQSEAHKQHSHLAALKGDKEGAAAKCPVIGHAEGQRNT
ncbi:MAG: hypothetical protein RLO18_12050, partial [Gimesia chilikensis]